VVRRLLLLSDTDGNYDKKWKKANEDIFAENLRVTSERGLTENRTNNN
jgi:hypothetical protein